MHRIWSDRGGQEIPAGAQGGLSTTQTLGTGSAFIPLELTAEEPSSNRTLPSSQKPALPPPPTPITQEAGTETPHRKSISPQHADPKFICRRFACVSQHFNEETAYRKHLPLACMRPLLLLLLLSRFSRVRLCATPWTAAHQNPWSLGFSRQEHASTHTHKHTHALQPRPHPGPLTPRFPLTTEAHRPSSSPPPSNSPAQGIEDLDSILQTDACLLIPQAGASRPCCPVTQLKAGSLNTCFLFVFPEASAPAWRSFPLARLPLRLWAWPASSTPLDGLPRRAWCEEWSFRDSRSSAG